MKRVLKSMVVTCQHRSDSNSDSILILIPHQKARRYFDNIGKTMVIDLTISMYYCSCCLLKKKLYFSLFSIKPWVCASVPIHLDQNKKGNRSLKGEKIASNKVTLEKQIEPITICKVKDTF